MEDWDDERSTAKVGRGRGGGQDAEIFLFDCH